MYQIENSGAVVRSRKERPSLWRAMGLVAPNVLFLGLTSFFTDISSEMVATVLPLYLVFSLQLAPFQYGIIDGLYQGAAVLVRLAGGLLADRAGRYKAVAGAGYALSAVSRIGLLLAGASWGALAALVLVDRTGKGIRTAPRDALIALSTPQGQLATAFGVHRALDTAGAMIGPLIAFLLLSLAPGAFDVVFVVSFCFALVGLGVLALFVQNRRAPAPGEGGALEAAAAPERPAVSLRAALGLLRLPRFGPLLAVSALLSVATLSDGFLYLTLQRRLDLAVGFFPLLYVITAFVFMLLAVPVGRVADRLGRERVFLAGYGLMLAVYLLLLIPGVPAAGLFGSLLLLGGYYAATDGVLTALASAALPAELRASGLALLSTATGIARLCASVLFGLLWSWADAGSALLSFLVALALGVAVAAAVVARAARRPAAS